MRYYVDAKATLVLVQAALDRQYGLRDAAGNPTPRERLVHRPGLGLVTASVALGPLHNCYDMPGRHWPLVEGGDGSAAIQVEDAIAAKLSAEGRLGVTVGGVAVPALAAFTAVTRPREHSLLPTGVRDVLDDRYVDAVLDDEDTPQRRAAIQAELTNGGRGAGALARRDARSAQAALAVAVGIVRSR